MTEDWAILAACRRPQFKGHADLWFASQGDREAVRAAKRVCADCPVRIQCGTYALNHSVPHGVWGGLTPRERRGLLRKWRAARAASRPLASA